MLGELYLGGVMTCSLSQKMHRSHFLSHDYEIGFAYKKHSNILSRLFSKNKKDYFHSKFKDA